MTDTKGGAVWVDIDGEKLKEQIKRKGFNPSQLAKALGCGHDITNAIRRGKMKKPLAILICSYLGIPFASFELVKETQAPTEPAEPQEIIIAPQISEEQWARLEKLIYDAVTRARKG